MFVFVAAGRSVPYSVPCPPQDRARLAWKTAVAVVVASLEIFVTVVMELLVLVISSVVPVSALVIGITCGIFDGFRFGFGLLTCLLIEVAFYPVSLGVSWLICTLK